MTLIKDIKELLLFINNLLKKILKNIYNRSLYYLFKLIEEFK